MRVRTSEEEGNKNPTALEA